MTALLDDAPAGDLARGPGVWLRELPLRAAPALPATPVPMFAGFVEPVAAQAVRPVRCAVLDRPADLEPRVGRAWPQGYLAEAVRGFFDNGGRRCVVLAAVCAPQADAGTLRAALAGLFAARGPAEDLPDVDLVCVPDLMAGALRDASEATAQVQRAVLRHCTRMNERFAILDCVTAADGGPAAERWLAQRRRLFEPAAGEADADPIEFADGALYGPWLRLASGRAVPPCGHVAGAFARSDAAAGAHASPANLVLEGVVDVEAAPAAPDRARLDAVGINGLRALPGRGVRIWGARTLAAPQSAMRYVGVRRLALATSRWLMREMADFVFEPAGPALWARVRERAVAHCLSLQRRGALRGEAPEQAFFVRCDAQTNPPEGRDAGRLVCEIGLAALAPAEFIVVRIARSDAALAVSTA